MYAKVRTIVLSFLLGLSLLVVAAPPPATATAGTDIARPAKSWMRTPMPRPRDAAFDPSVRQSACWADRRCVATGTYRQRSGNDAAVLWTLSGTRWKAVRAPVPGDAATNSAPFPGQVACGAAGLCAAYAAYTAHRDGRDVDGDLIWTRSGGRWNVAAPPVPADADAGTGADILGVACAGHVCAARGTYEFGGSARPALWSWTGGGWSVGAAPLPADAARVDLGAVMALACSADGTCEASGLYLANPGLVSHRALWRSTGAGWAVTQATTADGSGFAESTDFVAACAGGGVCMATLDVVRTASAWRTDLWTLDQDTWTRTALPLPAGAESPTAYTVDAVTCSSSGRCVAAGQYPDAAGDVQGALWVRSVKGAWRATRASLPRDAAQDPRTVVRRLSCSDDGVCVATGSYVHHSNGSDIDDEARYDRLQWSYAHGAWTRVARFGVNRAVDASPSLLTCGSDFCVRFDGFQTLWTSSGRATWRRFRPGPSLAGLADGAGVAFASSPGTAPVSWIYVG